MKAEWLAESGRRFAHLGLAEHQGPDGTGDLAVLYMSTAVEHLAKAVLCKIHPALILDAKQKNFFDALLYTTRHPASSAPLAAMRTISCGEALSRARRLDVRVPTEDEARKLIQARDGLVHLALPHESQGSELVALGVRICAALLHSLDLPDFWGGYAASVATLLDDHATEVQRIVALRLQAAVQRLRDQHDDLGEAERTALFNTIADAHEPDDDDSMAYPCPACGFNGVLTGNSEMREGEPDWDYADGQSYVSGVPVNVWLTADAFRCFVCDLRLSTPDELGAAGLPVEVEGRSASDDDLRDFYADYYEDRW